MDQVASGELIMPMARGASLNLLGQACTKLALLAITVVLSATLGASALGRYAQAYALLTLLVAVAGLPFGFGVTRTVAMHRANRDDGALHGTVRLSVGATLACSVLLAVPLFAFAGTCARDLFHDPDLVTPLRLVAMALPPAALAETALVATAGFSRMRARAVIKLVLEPVVRLGLTVGLILVGVGVIGATIALVASSLVEAVLAMRALHRYMGSVAPAPPRYQPRALFSYSLVSGTASLATNGLVWADTLILGALRSSADVGVYTVATRVPALATFVLPAVTQAFAPRITDLYHRGRRAELQHAYNVVTGWNLTLSLPAFALMLAFPAELLGLFGPAYSVAVTVTVVFSVGQIVNAATGPSGTMLTMSGRTTWNLADNAAALVLNVALNFLLIPSYGIIGAAVAWSVSLIVVNGARVVQVWFLLRMAPFQLAHLRTFLAAAVAACCGLIAAQPFSGPVRLAVGASVVGAAYVLAIAVLQRSTEDRLVAQMLAHRTVALLRPRRQT